jgi:hypothetical protein
MAASTLSKVVFFFRQFMSCADDLAAVANVMRDQTPQGGAIIGISSISALVGGAEQVYGFQHLTFPYISHS